MKRSSQSGSHVVALVLVVLFVAVAGFAGYKVWQMQQSAASSDTAAAVQVPAKITNTADLTQASKALDQASAQVSTSLDDGGLNSDLNDLL